MASPKYKLRRRVKHILGCLAILFFVLFSPLTSNKAATHFRTGFKTLVPTTSHSSDVDLKNFAVDDTSIRDSVVDLRTQLTFQFPYDPEQPIPRRVWQTWKEPLDSPNFPSSFRKYSDSWLSTIDESTSPYDYALVPDDHIIPLLQHIYGNVPQVIQAFESMPRNILKADFFRYLILFARGGIYSDMDTVPLKPLDSWPSKNETFLSQLSDPITYKNFNDSSTPTRNEPGFIVGIEADPDRPDWSEYYARRIQFCQWTIQSKPGHPILRELIINITATTLYSVSGLQSSVLTPDFTIDKGDQRDYNINMRGKKLHDPAVSSTAKKNSDNTDGTDIMNWTGPGIFSDVIMHYLDNLIQNNDNILIYNDNLYPNKQDPEEEEQDSDKTTVKFHKEVSTGLRSENHFHWGFFSLIKKPVIVDDVMVLPITSFSPDVGHMGAGSSDHRMAFVKHMFKGSWKPKDEGGNNT